MHVVAIEHALRGASRDLLERVLDRSGFWTAIGRMVDDTPRETFRIAIKPDLDTCEVAAPTCTDPALVLTLARSLSARGFTRIAVVDARNDPDAWLLNRDPLFVADLVGYDFSGEWYELADEVPAHEQWVDADFRINLAHNRTHETERYALCLHNLLGVADPSTGDATPADRAVALMRCAPPHFNLVDAIASHHGAAGQRAPHAMATGTLIAGTDARLVDLVGALKMGLDPYDSPLVARCWRTLGTPDSYRIEGELTPYPLWNNVPPALADAARRRDAVPQPGVAAGGWFQTTDTVHFPFREFYADRINAVAAPLMARVGEDRRALIAVVAINHLLAGIGHAATAQHTLFSKGKLRREARPLQIDPQAYSVEDYVAAKTGLAWFEPLLTGTPSLGDGVRLQRLDDALLFAAEYEFASDFDTFVERVNVEHAIQYMNDYLGGELVVVARDEGGRVTRQAERNLYLQQPNWMVLVGGEVIDVEKLELIERERDRHSIYWRTVASPNGSAVYDDGRVTFVRTAQGGVRMEIVTRQKFTLPLFFRVAHIDLFPAVRDPVVEQGYRRFFAQTVANVQARYEGKDYRIGHDPQGLQSGLSDLARFIATAFASLAEVLRHRADTGGLGEWFAARSWQPVQRTADSEDADGFRHFAPSPTGSRYDRSDFDAAAYAGEVKEIVTELPGLWAGLAEAVQRDADAFARKNDTGGAS